MREPGPVVLVLLVSLFSETGASCPIALTPPSVVVRHGDSVSVNCSTSESQFEGMGWEAQQGGTGLKKVHHLVWTVPRLTEWKVSPFCFITPSSLSHFQQCTLRPRVTVYTFPESISLRSSRIPGGVMKEGEEYQFTCEVQRVAPVQNLTVSWFRGDVLVYTDAADDPSKKAVNHSSVLNFTSTRRDHGTTIRCEAHLDLSPEGPQLHASSPDYNITVYFGPDVQCSAASLVLLEGETLDRKCPVTGNPSPEVTWLKDGRPTDPTVALSRNDGGLYTVRAEGAAMLEKTLRILILYGPELKCPSSYTVLEDAPHNLTCIVEGYPQPVITWSKDGEEVELKNHLRRSDKGQYWITASSKLSSVNVSVDINVIYPPAQIVELEDSEVNAGSSVWLKCSSTGNPRPRYSWSYYRTANVMEDTEDGVSRLHIHNATVFNMGTYTCSAWNDAGNVSRTARVTVNGARRECPIDISPDRMLIPYQSRGPHRATCTPASTDAIHVTEIYWQDQQGTSSPDWFADSENSWDARPVCTVTFNVRGTCQKRLNVTLYKSPDSVSIRRVEELSPVVEQREFQLQCDVTNVAPAGNLVVRWYRGNETFYPPVQGALRVSGCPPGNGTDCDISAVRSPLNVSSTVNITLNRNHSGAEFRCEAQLDLGPEGPQPPPHMVSSPLNITIYYKPTINTTRLPKTVPVFRGYPEELVCEADGHPPPKVQWLYSPDKVLHDSGDTLIVSEAGVYNCSATNEVDSTSHQVLVILKEDYLPLIAGFVAVTVVAISIVFLFIYSIYYKNTKMRRYSLKNPKLDTPSGNVAHNGWDMQFPMTKLS